MPILFCPETNICFLRRLHTQVYLNTPLATFIMEANTINPYWLEKGLNLALWGISTWFSLFVKVLIQGFSSLQRSALCTRILMDSSF